MKRLGERKTVSEILLENTLGSISVIVRSGNTTRLLFFLMTPRTEKEESRTMPAIRKTLSKNLIWKDRLNGEARKNSYIYFGW